MELTSSSSSSPSSSPSPPPSADDFPLPKNRPITVEERRARQRLHVRRSYYRKLNNIQTLRQQVQELQDEYEQLRQQKEEQSSRAVVQYSQTDDEDDQEDTSTKALYERLTALKISLREENVAMKKTVKEYERFYERMQHIARSDQDQIDDGRCPPSMKPPSELPEAEPIELVPLTLEDCQIIAMTAYQEICQFMESHSFLTTGAPIFGWRDRRQQLDDHIKFTLNKRFPGQNNVSLSTRAWRIMSSETGLSGLYSPSIQLTIKTVQVIDDDNVVMYRVIFGADRKSFVKTLFLVSRFCIGSRYVILFRTIDRERFVRRKTATPPHESETELDRLGRKEAWMEMYTWTIYDAAADDEDTCLFNFGGVVHSNAATSTNFWMMEILFLALRFETKVIGPLITLEQ